MSFVLKSVLMVDSHEAMLAGAEVIASLQGAQECKYPSFELMGIKADGRLHGMLNPGSSRVELMKACTIWISCSTLQDQGCSLKYIYTKNRWKRIYMLSFVQSLSP